MISLTADEAFRAYEAVRHRLPAARQRDEAYKQIETLAEIADHFDVFLLDAFGVLNVGETAIPGAVERVRELKQSGKHVIVVSNAASVPQGDLVAKYRRLGFDFPPEDIITSRATMAAYMDVADVDIWGVMQGSHARLDDLAPLRITPLADDASAYKTVGGFLLIGSAGWTEARQSLLEAALSEAPRPVLIANPDIVAPRETGFSAEPGYFAHRLADRTGVEPEFFGKPFPNIFDLAFQRVGQIEKNRIVMVGDSLHTDILGAQAVGIASVLVTRYGLFAGQDFRSAVANTGIAPEFVASRP